MTKVLGIAALAATAGSALAQVRITEYMYQGAGSSNEFVEITNITSATVSMAGWSFDDNTRTPGSFDISGFGSILPGESVIITEVSDAAFRAAWGLSASVKVLGGNTNNLGRADEINIYNGSTLVDRLTYDDQTLGGPRTNLKSGNTGLANLGANTITTWTLSAVADSYGSYASTLGDIGNPGKYLPIPAPGSVALVGLGLLAARRSRR